MAAPPQVSTITLRALRDAAEQVGLRFEAVARSAGLTLAQCDDVDGRVPIAAVFRMWEAVSAASGDEAFGVRLAFAAPIGSTGVADYVCRNAPTIRDALADTERYCRIVNDGAVVTITEAPDRAALHYGWRVEMPTHPRAYPEFFLMYMARTFRDLTDGYLPWTISFRHHAPADLRPYTNAFGCPVKFDQPENAFTFDPVVLDRPNKHADPALRGIVQHFADEMLERLPKQEGFVDVVRSSVAQLLSRGAPLEEVARRLAMSPRSLQRRMREVGTTYQEFVNDTRADLAASYLEEGAMPVGEIAFLLGYSEPSAFYRSFKRARGVTPREFRARAS